MPIQSTRRFWSVAVSKACEIHVSAILPLVLTLLVGCAGKEPIPDENTGPAIKGTDLLISLPGAVKLAVGAEFIATGDANDGEAPIRIFSRRDGSAIAAAYSSDAETPRYSWIGSLQFHRDRGSDALWVYDVRLASLLRYPLHRGTRLLPETAYAVAVSDIPLVTYWMDDTLLVTSGVFTQPARYYLWTPTRTPKPSGLVPYLTPATPVFALQQALQPSVAVHPAGRMVAIGSRFAGRLDVYRIPNDTPTVAQTPHSFEPPLRIGMRGTEPHFLQDRSTRAGYIAVTATHANIFALFSGQNAETAKGSDRPGTAVDVFDWSGNFQRTLLLDREALEIAVDPTGSELVALVEKNAKEQRAKRYWLRKYAIPAAPLAESESSPRRGGL